MNAPELSILIVAYNSSIVLPACLDSVAAETNLAHEIIIVDNASSDGTPRLICTHFPQVTLIENQENVGFAAATNTACRLAQGLYLLLLNPDTLVNDRAIDHLVHFMDVRPTAHPSSSGRSRSFGRNAKGGRAARRIPPPWLKLARLAGNFARLAGALAAGGALPEPVDLQDAEIDGNVRRATEILAMVQSQQQAAGKLP
jgi:glycosyltransferase involved in cell wall biosynthesis